MVKTSKILTIFLATVVVCGVLLWLMVQITDQDPSIVAQSPTESIQIVDVCAENKRLEHEVVKMIASSRLCEFDDDCGFVYLSCPLGCFKAVSVASIPGVKALHEDYLNTKDECPGCVYRCVNSARYQASCDSGLCSVKDSDTWKPPGFQPLQEPSSVLP